MNDQISRKAAIDQLHQSYNLLDAERRLEDMPSAQPEIDCMLKEYGDCTYSETGCSDCKIKAEIKKALKSAQPVARDTNVLSNDLISRLDAIETSLEFFIEFLGGAFYENSQKELIARFQRVSSAQPEIIRCKDCKHRDPEDKKCDSGHFIQWQLPRDDNWFCADAERLEEGE